MNTFYLFKFFFDFNIIFLNRIKWKISINNKNKKIEINAIYNI